MNSEIVGVLEECANGSLAGTISFPQVLEKLSAIGVERYHADYSRQEITYYLKDGRSHVLSIAHPQQSIGIDFQGHLVAAAVKQSQGNEHTYSDFLLKTMLAGCVGYFVQISGARVIYFGRNGDSHVEHFPVSSST
ncbi:MAG: DUF1398 family protein [Candidatus Obscuribacterales bacterium]|jgi:uncharacterized protein YbcV (DUF1398 family)